LTDRNTTLAQELGILKMEVEKLKNARKEKESAKDEEESSQETKS